MQEVIKSGLKKRKSTSLGNRVAHVKMRRSGRQGIRITFEDVMALKHPPRFDNFENSLLKMCRVGNHMDDRVRAVYELALFYCQIGSFEKADEFLRTLGYRFRLGRNIWTMSSVNSKSDSIPAACFDNVFPPFMIRKLLDIFKTDSTFWSDHNYPSDTFFSYNTLVSDEKTQTKSGKLGGTDKNNLIAQLAVFLKPLVLESFPHIESLDIHSVEWWAHTRPNGPSAGHRLHYDLDEVSLNTSCQQSSTDSLPIQGANSIHPLVSSVIYLDDGGSSGAPTLLIDQHLDGHTANRAWACSPKTSRLLLFDGRLLHGVVPHISQSSRNHEGARVTLMIGWWGEQVHLTPYSSTEKYPNMAMPASNLPRKGSHNGVTWPSLFAPLSFKDNKLLHAHLSSVEPSNNQITEVDGPVWEEIGMDGRSSGVAQDKEMAAIAKQLENIDNTGDIVFVGNWFLRDENEINEEILSAATASCGKGGIADRMPRDCSGPDSTVADERKGQEEAWMSLEDLMRLRG